MNLRKGKAIFAIFIGVSIISLWIMLFLSSQIPELRTEPISISLHIFSEILLAITLIIAGIKLFKDTNNSKKWFLLAMGLLIYSVINAAGYYGQNNEWAMVIMFGVIFMISTFFVVLSLKDHV
ncbi:hypothetical protein I5677_08460 [Mobilitalea sibirica]|uniref:DUF8058 domain-containing protein n=1 Tax=Mobilitalea sibirica TaxID=1462919 RepID=A0A8J7H2T0_9FIRM|nr:hypothetical protein [Mobilitalea sibirica]MBH1940920.1 hypothetical protein [Mobilitalea sibirica]